MEKFIFEKRKPTAREKACKAIFDKNNKKIILPLYKGAEEAEARLNGDYFVIAYVTKSGYIPVRFRNDNYFVV